MKRVLYFLIVLFLYSMPSYAQGRQGKNESNFVVKAGINFSNITVTDNGSIDKANALTGFHAGLLVDLPLASFFSFQGGLLFTVKGAKTEINADSVYSKVKTTSNPLYIEIPLNLVAKIPIGFAKLIVGVGLYGAIGITGKNNVEIQLTNSASTYSNKDIVFDGDSNAIPSRYGFGNLKRFDYGANVLAGLELTRFTMTANYGIGFTNINLGSSNTMNDKYKYRVLSFSLGIKI